MTFICRADLMKRQVRYLLHVCGGRKALLKSIVAEAGAVNGIFLIWVTQTGLSKSFTHKDDCNFGQGNGVEG